MSIANVLGCRDNFCFSHNSTRAKTQANLLSEFLSAQTFFRPFHKFNFLDLIIL